jgi:GNAT superfamily N-acetyltransferase
MPARFQKGNKYPCLIGLEVGMRCFSNVKSESGLVLLLSSTKDEALFYNYVQRFIKISKLFQTLRTINASPMVYSFQILTQKAEMLPHYPLIRQLSPGVTAERYDFLLDDMLAHGYRMAAVFEGADCVGISGIWVATKIYSGRYLEMDNVVVADTHRSKGIGQLLTDFVISFALDEGCETIMLDAYLENEKAHVFYERAGFVKRGYHFIRKI